MNWSDNAVFQRTISSFLMGTVGFLMCGSAGFAQQTNMVALENGAVLTSYTSEFGGRNQAAWIALALIDSDPKVGWSSAKNQALQNEFVFELAEDYLLQRLLFDNTHTDEPTHAGISARNVLVFVSQDGTEGSYRQVFQGEISAGKVTDLQLEQPAPARWIKLVLADNGGHAEYTELMEFSALGQPLGNRQEATEFSGVYSTNWGPFFLKYNKGELSGCYDHDNGNFVGTSVDGVMNIEWREDGDDSGSAVLALSANGAQFSGLWYKNAELHGTWMGTRTADQSRAPNCAGILKTVTKSKVAQSLDTYGVSRLYGIYFDFDSDVIKPESAQTLSQVHAWLVNNPGKSVVFEGHTDSQGKDDYNRTLSNRRAYAVITWLAQQGVDVNRLEHVGHGESLPVADNATVNGRSLNRRVEMKVVN